MFFQGTECHKLGAGIQQLSIDVCLPVALIQHLLIIKHIVEPALGSSDLLK